MSFTSYNQYLRRVTLVVADDYGKGLDLSCYRVKFNTTQWSFQSPSRCDIRVFNVSNDTAQKVQDEFAFVTLNAGYEGGNEAQIFKGELVQVRRGRDSPVDTYLDLTAIADEASMIWSIIKTTAGRGSTYDKRISLVADALKVKIGAGGLPDKLPDDALPRQKTMFGMAHEHMRDLAMATDTNWFVQDGQLIMVKQDGYLPGHDVYLNSATGLIGMPEQTQQGITVKCLLNPLLACMGRVILDNESINLSQIETAYGDTAAQQNFLLPQLDQSLVWRDKGQYVILQLEHSGDTRGNEYYSNMICWSLKQGIGPGGTLPAELVNKGYTLNG